jgi:hypothetical protein
MTSIEVEGHISKFDSEIKLESSNASFDFCFNYFQSFRDAGQINEIASSSNLETSCLHLSAYLAAWGMYRGSARLGGKSINAFVKLVELVANSERVLWEIDVDRYSAENVERLIHAEFAIGRCLGEQELANPNDPSRILTTKIMLGVFGNVPAFDNYFCQGCSLVGIPHTFSAKALVGISEFYVTHKLVFDQCRRNTLTFAPSALPPRGYTNAKLVDMALFNAGFFAENPKARV